MNPKLADKSPESGKTRSKSKIEKLVPEIVLTAPQGTITLKQLEVLKAVAQERSQNRAAEKLKISTAVFNRQLKELERKAKMKLVKTSKRGSELTADGKKIIELLDAFNNRIERPKELVVGCTSISRMLVERICSRLAEQGTKARIIIADDESNKAMATGKLIDLVFYDDPVHAYEFPQEGRVHEVVKDYLIHCERGKHYAQLISGPQRIGFEMLRQENRDFEIVKIIFSPEELLKTDYSYFVSRMLLHIRKLHIPDNAKIRTIPYTLYAIEITDHPDLQNFLNCMAPQQYHPIG